MSEHGRPVARLFARTLFDGLSDRPAHDRLITIKDGMIAQVRECPAGDPLPPDTIQAGIAAPGFIDMQINGAADTQFNEEPTADAIARIAAGARQGGTAHILPTFITAPDMDYRAAIAAANQAVERRSPGVLGIHLEGPFLSPDRPGIHPPRFIRPMTDADVAAIGEAAGTVLVTLAPECQDHDLVGRLARSGALVFVGHSNATAAQINTAIEAGISGVTHLFNAQSQIAGRDPGIVGSALMRAELAAGIIADGVHVHPGNLAMAARLMGNRLCLVTDAMKTLAGTLTAFDLYGTPVTLDEGRLRGPDGTLAGAHLAMDEAVRNAISMMGVSRAAALKMAGTNVAHALGLGGELGLIMAGRRASITLLDDDLHARGVVVDGRFY
ncbi:MAG: N-acetylglucosamine-6-phosphate deacetylase [Phyllobacteriaceae bacterium]|nr:N-acetylglucosamine-6-phosphate deacetylase [Phyllobacteriaceae bacterium]